MLATFKFLAAAMAAGIVAQLMKVLVWPYIDMTTFNGVFIQLVASFSSGVIVYALFCYLLGSEEFIGFLNTCRNKLPFKKIKIGDQGEARGM